MSQVHFIVFANEKGGTGKSTTAVHTAIALAASGHRVGVLDLDSRQRTTTRYLENRDATMARLGEQLPQAAYEVLDDQTEDGLTAAIDRLSATSDVIVIDTPGRDDPVARAAILRADTLVTPMNDSFVDFDMLGVVDPVTLELTRHSLYSETVWNSRKVRAAKDRKMIDWVVLRNRLAPTEARNRKRLEERIESLSRKVGFRIGPGLRDRVIYRELFPFGLTVADLSPTIRPVAMSLQHVAARQELRALMAALGLSGFSDGEQIAAE